MIAIISGVSRNLNIVVICFASGQSIDPFFMCLLGFLCIFFWEMFMHFTGPVYDSEFYFGRSNIFSFLYILDIKNFPSV